MSRNSLLGAACLAGMIVTACGEPMSPCKRNGGCEVPGPDLVLSDVRVLEPQPVSLDAVTRLPIIRGPSIRAEYMIRNRGDTIAPPAHVRITLRGETITRAIPALAPGQRLRDTVSIALPRHLIVNETLSDIALRRLNIDSLHAHVLIDGWETTLGKRGTSAPFHFAVPIIKGRISGVSRQELRINQPFVFTIEMSNLSVHGASFPPTDLVLCLWDYDVACRYSNWTHSDRVSLPALLAGQSYRNAFPVFLVPSAAWQDDAFTYHLSACTIAPTDTDPYLGALHDHGCFFRTEPIRVRPDYQSCSPPLLAAGQAVTLSARNCGRLPLSTRPGASPSHASRHEFFLFAVDVAANQSFSVQRLSAAPLLQFYDAAGERAADIDPAPDRIAFASAGRYYIVVYGNPPFTLAVSLSD